MGKEECRARWREWGPKDCCLHQKDGQCICLKQTCVSTLTHAQPYAIFFFFFFFLKWMSAWIGTSKLGPCLLSHLWSHKAPPWGSCPMGLGGLLESGASHRLCCKKTAFLALKDRTPSPDLSRFFLLQNHCASGTSEHPTSPLFSLLIVVILGQQGAAENERGILWTVMDWTHQTPLVWHCFPVFPTVSGWPHFFVRGTCRSPPLMLVYEIGKCWELYSVHGIEWAAHVCQLQG